MFIENLTFEHARKLLLTLEKNKLQCYNINISFYDRIKYQYITFSNYKEFNDYYITIYKNYKKCHLGDFVHINKLKINSDLYNFNFTFLVYDILNTLKITINKDSDINRNKNRESLINKQTLILQNNLIDYKNTITKILKIYKTGIYSPCYANPAWSEGTSLWPKGNDSSKNSFIYETPAEKLIIKKPQKTGYLVDGYVVDGYVV